VLLDYGTNVGTAHSALSLATPASVAVPVETINLYTVSMELNTAPVGGVGASGNELTNTGLPTGLHDSDGTAIYNGSNVSVTQETTEFLVNGYAWTDIMATSSLDLHTSTTDHKVDGTINNDTIIGSQGNDVLYGGDGNDTITAGTKTDTSKTDTIFGGAGDDTITGGNSTHTTLYGDGGNDILIGGSGGATMFGGDGNDTFKSGSGNDVMWGGAGHNVFQFNLSQNQGHDSVMDMKQETLQQGTTNTLNINDVLDFSTGSTLNSSIQSWITAHDPADALGSNYAAAKALDALGTLTVHDDGTNVNIHNNTTGSDISLAGIGGHNINSVQAILDAGFQVQVHV